MFNSDLERVAVHAHIMRFNRFKSGQLDGFAARDIEERTMPRTLDFLTFQLTLIQRAAIMRAQIIDGVELTIHVAHRDGAADRADEDCADAP